MTLDGEDLFEDVPGYEVNTLRSDPDCPNPGPSRAKKPGTFTETILRELKNCQPNACDYAYLYKKCRTSGSNRLRDLVIAIIQLRNNGWNIEHNSLAEKLKLLEGRRIAKGERYQEALWKKFCEQKEALWRQSDTTIALNLSDEGYRVDFWGVGAIKILWTLMFKSDYSKKHFLLQQKAWNVILQDFRVYGQPYYGVHPHVCTNFSSRDITNFNKMFDFYKDSVESQDTKVITVKNNLPPYMQMCTQGVTLQEIQDFLKESGVADVNGWMGLRILMRGGYSQHIRYHEGRFYWDPNPSAPVAYKSDLLISICDLFKEKSCCYHITFALYKRGFFEATPFDVNNILDILIATQFLQPDRDYVYGGVVFGPGGNPQYLQELRKNGTLSKTIHAGPKSMLAYLRVHVYPKYFGWEAQVPISSYNRKKPHSQILSHLEVVKKKPRIEQAERVQEASMQGWFVSREGVCDRDISTCPPGYFDADQLLVPVHEVNASDDRFSLMDDFSVDGLCMGEPVVASSGGEFSGLAGLSEGTVLLPASDEDFSGSEYDLLLSSPVRTLSGGANAVPTQPYQEPPFSSLQHSHDSAALLGCSYNYSEKSVETQRPLEKIEQCIQKRQQSLLAYLTQKEHVFCSFEELRALYSEDATKENLLEDALSLMHRNHNVEYNQNNEQYRLRTGPVEQGQKYNEKNPRTSSIRFFCAKLKNQSFASLNTCEKTLVLYEHGYSFVPLSTVALFETLGRVPGSTAQWSQREARIEALKDKILEEEVLSCDYEYSGLFPKYGKIYNKDVFCVKKSLELYPHGRAILQKNLQEKAGVKRLKRRKKGQVSHPEVLDILRMHKGQPCSEKSLKEITLAGGSHSFREVYCTIAELRALSHNIIHDGVNFTLLDGKREEKNGFYKKVTWRLLEGVSFTAQTMRKLFLRVSNLGYNPLWYVVEHIVILKKLCIKDKSLPDHRLAMWDTIVGEGELREASYYESRSNSEKLTGADMRTFSICWNLYNHIMYNQDPELARATKKILESQPEGLSLQTLVQILSKDTQISARKHLNAWSIISGLMRCGYAGQMSVTGETVTWCKDAPKIAPTSNPLYQALYNIPLDCAAGEATILLHKQGHFNVSPWDVEQLLDIFAFMGYREGGRYHALHALWQGHEHLTGIAYRDAVLIKRIKWLQKVGVLESMQKGVIVPLEKMLQTEEWLSVGER